MTIPAHSLRPFLPIRPALAATLLLTLAPVVFAQAQDAASSDDADPVQLDKFDVNGLRDQDYASTLSTGGLKTATPLVETPQAISIVTRYQIEDQAAQNMQEVLRYVAGVRAEMYGVDNRGDYFTMRGGSEGSTVLDGLRLPLTGWWGSVRNEPFAFERVEVLRGPVSVLYGQNGPGGVVNLVSKLPQATARGELNVQVGTNEHKQAAFDLTGPANADGSLLYRVVGLAKDAGTQVDHAYEERTFFAPSLTWRVSPATSITVQAQYQKDESDNTNAFLPWAGTLFSAPNGPISDALFIGEPDWDTYGGERLRLGHEIEHRINSAWTLRHHFRYDHVDGHLLTMYADWGVAHAPAFVDAQGDADPNGQYLNRIWYGSEYHHHIANTDVLLEGRFDVGATRHTLLVGVDGFWSRHDELSTDGLATPLNVYSPVYGTFARPTLNYTGMARTNIRQIGVMLQDQIKFDDRWSLVGSLRRDELDNTGQKDDAVTGRAGLVYLADGGWAPYVSYAESFEAVGGLDSSGHPYKPKRGEQLEAGVKWAPKDGRIAASAAAYTLKEKNRLSPNPDPTKPAVQRGEVTVNGVELETTATFASWSFVGNYTFTYSEVSASSVPNEETLHHRLTSIPKHSASLWTVHSFSSPSLRGLRAGFGVRYVGETWDGTDTIRTPSNTLFDAMVSYDQGRWHYALNASNVFDKRYIATALDRGDAWFGSRRKVIATVSYRW